MENLSVLCNMICCRYYGSSLPWGQWSGWRKPLEKSGSASVWTSIGVASGKWCRLQSPKKVDVFTLCDSQCCISVLIKFLCSSEIVGGNTGAFLQVMVMLMKKAEKSGRPVHELSVLQLGVEARVQAYAVTAEAYLQQVSMRCLDFTGQWVMQ